MGTQQPPAGAPGRVREEQARAELRVVYGGTIGLVEASVELVRVLWRSILFDPRGPAPRTSKRDRVLPRASVVPPPGRLPDTGFDPILRNLPLIDADLKVTEETVKIPSNHLARLDRLPRLLLGGDQTDRVVRRFRMMK